jgi:hypothetical protein
LKYFPPEESERRLFKGDLRDMKKKSANSLTKTEERRPPVFCEATEPENAALGRLALRVLMSDIRKHKLSAPEETEKAARGFGKETSTEE